MNASYAEHLEHVAGTTSESANCLTEANIHRLTVADVNETKIATALDRGLFVAVVDSHYYCRATDAFAGSYRHFLGSFATREEANAYAAANTDLEADDSPVYVLPLLQKPAQVLVPMAEDQCPF